MTELMKYASLTDLRLLAPMILVAVVACALLMLQVFQRAAASRTYLAWVAVAGLAAAGIDTLYLLGRGTQSFAMGQMLFVDGFALMVNLICIFGAILACLISPAYLADHRMARGEYYALILFSVVGMMVMAAGADLFAIFIGLEMMSIPVYCLAGFFRHSNRSAEAAMKYFFLGAIASAIFLYGIALLYGVTGTTNLVLMARALDAGGVSQLSPNDVAGASALAARTGLLEFVGVQAGSGLPLFKLGMLPGMGLVMVLVAFAFKVALVPFHMWTPDAYQGSPSSAVAFMSTAVKAAAFAGLIRVFFVAFWGQPARLSGTGWVGVLFFLALVSMVYGNLAAIVQKNVKRILAYSSVAHGGYITVGVVAAAAGPTQVVNLDGVLFYLVVYTAATAGAFGVLAYFGKRGEECQTLEDLSGIAERYPGAALAMTIFLLSSAGIPPTGGFLAKFYVFKAAIQTGDQAFIGLAIAGVLASVAGVYYYLKIIMAMYMKTGRRRVQEVSGLPLRLALTICAAVTLLLGVYPSPVLNTARDSVVGALGWSAEVRQGLNAAKSPRILSLEDAARPADAASTAALVKP